MLEVEHKAKKRIRGSRRKIIICTLKAKFLSQHTNVIVSNNGGVSYAKDNPFCSSGRFSKVC